MIVSVRLLAHLPYRRTQSPALSSADSLVYHDAVVPQVQLTHGRKPDHPAPVGSPDREGCCPPLESRETAIPCQDSHANSQSLHIPLEGAGQCLVEIVDPEQECTFR